MHPIPRLASLLLALVPAAAGASLQVVTTTDGLAALARDVGGDRVAVTALSHGNQDPHFVDPNPNLAVKLRDADLLVDVGLDLEIGWLPPLVNQSRNAGIQPGNERRFTAASAIRVLDVPTGPVDRSLGDLHPAGNPHFLDDPRRAVEVAQAMAAKLASLDPAGAAGYRARAADFARRIGADEQRWLAALKPFRGQAIIAKHPTVTYLARWAGLRIVGYLEPKPGVEPPPSHLAEMVEVARAQKVRAILVETYYDTRTAALVAKLSGARVASIPGDVGASRTATGYQAYMDEVVKALAGALAP